MEYIILSILIIFLLGNLYIYYRPQIEIIQLVTNYEVYIIYNQYNYITGKMNRMSKRLFKI